MTRSPVQASKIDDKNFSQSAAAPALFCCDNPLVREPFSSRCDRRYPPQDRLCHLLVPDFCSAGRDKNSLLLHSSKLFTARIPLAKK